MKIIILILLGFLISGESIATYRVEGMMCEMNCPKKVNDALNDTKGIKSCAVNFELKTATVTFDNDVIDSDKIAKTIADSTYYKVIDLNKQNGSESFWNWLFGKS